MKKLLYFVLLLTLLLIFPACTTPEDRISIYYESTEIEMFVGETINVQPSIEGNVTSDYKFNYELSDAIAEIDEDGNLTALAEGNVEVFTTIDIEASTNAILFITITKEEGVYTVVLDVNGGDKLESNVIKFKRGDEVVLPTPTKEGYIFKGWYQGDSLVTSISLKNYELVAKWESLDSIVQVGYELPNDVYLSNYTSREQLVNDFIKDLKSIKGTSYTLESLLTHEGTAFNIFVGSKGVTTFFSSEEMRVKWGWLIDYLKDCRKELGLDVSQYENLVNDGYVSTGAITINLEFLAFFCQTEKEFVSEQGTYITANYGTQEKANGFWNTMTEYYKNNNTYKKEVNALSSLPKALKVGCVFEGWYTTSDLDPTSKITGSYEFNSNMTLYPKFEKATGTINVTFDYNGGVNETLYQEFGTRLSTITLSGYNGNFWEGTNYSSNIFISDKANDPGATFSTRIYIGKDEYTDVYKIVSILTSGTNSSWPKKAEYVITISGQYSGTYDDNFKASSVGVGDVVVFDKDIKSISSSSLGVMSICDKELTKFELKEIVNAGFTVPTPVRVGYNFEGWYDDFGNKYESTSNFDGMSNISLRAIWRFKGQIIGEFETKSWTVKGNNVQLLSTFIGESNGNLVWKSENPEIATVSSTGTVTGVSEGLATIIVCDPVYEDVYFTFYVSVFDEDPSGILKLLVDSNNATVYNRNDLIIGIITEAGYYYADVIGGVSKLLFEDYVVHKDYYLSNPTNKSNLVAAGIEFVTVHYAADMSGSATNGGRGLASYNKSCNESGRQASWHYGTGNDGVWACQTESYGAWHAGSSKAMTWHDTGIKYNESDPEFPKITLGSDNYFYLNGQKTKVANTTTGKKLNNMGLAFKIVNGVYYLSGHYYSSSYGYISSTGGNNNSIGIETSCSKGSDLWLTWQYTAQLCADLLIRYNLPITKMVGHHFFSGKWCPQPMLEYDMEIWWEYVELVRQEMELMKNYSDYELSFASSSEYLKDNGRVTHLPSYSECVTYTVTYTKGNETKTVTLSSMLPGLEG